MSFVNTRTILGEQAALDAAVAHTLTELNEDGITIIPRYCIEYQDNLLSINFPNAIRIEQNSIAYNNPLLETIDIGKQCNIANLSIRDCPKLKALILRGTTGISTLGGPNALDNTPIIVYTAGIFVPRVLINDYVSDNNWSKYAKVIRAIEDMPITDLSTITHTWTQIKSMVDDESFFSSNYTIGDFKKFTYGTHTAIAEIAKVDNINKYVDFVLNSSDEEVKRNNTETGIAYANSNIKARLDEIYSNELPSDMKAVISSVSKKYYKYDGTMETVVAPLWLLNTKDVNLTGPYLKETEGEEYPIFNAATNLAKVDMMTQSASSWWLGSAYNSSNCISINNGGNPASSRSTYSYGLIFGFRIQKTT